MFGSIAVLRYLLYGFQLASQVLVSSDLAKNTPKRARWTAIRATRMGILVACATAFALWIGRESIADASPSPSKRGGGVTSQKIHWITLW